MTDEEKRTILALKYGDSLSIIIKSNVFIAYIYPICTTYAHTLRGKVNIEIWFNHNHVIYARTDDYAPLTIPDAVMEALLL